MWNSQEFQNNWLSCLWRNRLAIKSKALLIPPFTLSHLVTISLISLYCFNKSCVSSVHTKSRYNKLGCAAITNYPKFQQLRIIKVFFLLLLCIHCMLAVAFAPCLPHSRNTDDGDTTTWNSTSQHCRWRERWRIMHIIYHLTYISLIKENQIATDFKGYGECNSLFCLEREMVYQ